MFVQACGPNINVLYSEHIVCVGLVFSEGCGSSGSLLHCVLRSESTFDMVGICRYVWNGMSAG